MNLRPLKTIRQLKLLVDSLHRVIEQQESISASKDEIITLHQQRIKLQGEQVTMLTDLLRQQNAKVAEIQAPVPMPLPTVEAVEGLVSAFFDAESVIIARQAIELTRNYAPLGPDDVRATHKCLMKLWRTYAMRKLEQAAKSDVL